ncbi:MAG: MBL fold metallo-hydrolase [Methanomassiliicoccales archaeon]|nr:MBL fold metallo-hydrolase [Methanomassiliicoccales archaeon]
MKVTVYGGAGVIGGNKVHVDLGDRGLFFDFGEPFDVGKKYCAEFIRPRAARGLRDYLRLGMLPALDCYRPDLYPGDLTPSDMTPVRVDALFLSHAHFDHYGNVGFLRRDIPIVASPMTYAILRAYSELGKANASTELFDHVLREEMEGESRVLVTPRTKDKEVQGRKWVLTGEVIEDDPQWRKGTASEVVCGDGTINGIEYRAFPVDHSVYGATAFAVRRGKSDWLVYSGDLRMHGSRGEMTAHFADAARELSPKALVIEGTRIGRSAEDAEITESMVRESCRAAVEEGKGLTIADFSANNFERLDTFISIARSTGKRMVVTSKDVAFLESISKVDGNVRKDDLYVYRSLSETDLGVVDGLREKGWQVADPDDIAKSPDEYMLCFSFWDMTKLLDLEWKGGTYIYSNSEAYDLKQVDNLQKLMNWIDLFGFRCRGLAMKDGELEFEKGFHSSGHLSLPHLWRVVEQISPEVVIPVHCADPENFASLCPVRTVLPVKGQAIDI